MKLNITNCYCYCIFLTIMMVFTINLTMSRIELLHDRCDYLENQIKTIKNEAESNDDQSFIQLHNCNK